VFADAKKSLQAIWN